MCYMLKMYKCFNQSATYMDHVVWKSHMTHKTLLMRASTEPEAESLS